MNTKTNFSDKIGRFFEFSTYGIYKYLGYKNNSYLFIRVYDEHWLFNEFSDKFCEEEDIPYNSIGFGFFPENFIEITEKDIPTPVFVSDSVQELERVLEALKNLGYTCPCDLDIYLYYDKGYITLNNQEVLYNVGFSCSALCSTIFNRYVIHDYDKFINIARRLKAEIKPINKIKDMKKKDLKTGMIVTLRDGQQLVVMKNCVCDAETLDVLLNLTSKSGDTIFLKFSDYDDDLTCKYYNKYDVMKVEQASNHRDIARAMASKIVDCKISPRLLLAREETVELTLSEIAEKLNIPVEQLRIKE